MSKELKKEFFEMFKVETYISLPFGMKERIASPKGIEEIAWKALKKNKINVSKFKDVVEDFELEFEGGFMLKFINKECAPK